MLSEALQRNAKHETPASNISGRVLAYLRKIIRDSSLRLEWHQET